MHTHKAGTFIYLLQRKRASRWHSRIHNTLLGFDGGSNTCWFTCLRDATSCSSLTKENLNLLVMLQIHMQEKGISLAASISVETGSLHSPQGAHGSCGLYTEPQKFLHFSLTSYRNQLVKIFMWTRVSKDSIEESVSEKWQAEDICSVNAQILLVFWQDPIFWSASFRSTLLFWTSMSSKPQLDIIFFSCGAALLGLYWSS